MPKSDKSVISKNLANALSDEKSIEIISLLEKSPLYVRKISQLTGEKESRISERLRNLRLLGLIDYRWKRNGNKNIKEYYLITKKIEIEIKNGITSIKIKGKNEKPLTSKAIFDFTFPRFQYFIGRKSELEQLKSNYHVMVTGISGIGKTALVAEFARKCENPVFWHDTNEMDTLDYILMKFAVFLSHFDKRDASKLIELGAEKRYIIDHIIFDLKHINPLIVFDDLDKCRDSSIISFVRNIINAEPKIRLIAISKRNFDLTPYLKVINLGPLSFDESYELLKARGKIHDPKTISNLSGYPLALTLFNGKRNEEMISERVTDLVASEILAQLNGQRLYILQVAALFRTPFTIKQLNETVGLNVQDQIEELTELGYIYKRGIKYRVHDLIRVALSSVRNLDYENLHFKIANTYLDWDNPGSILEALYHISLSNHSQELISLLKKGSAILIDEGYIESFLAALKEVIPNLTDTRARGWCRLWEAKLEQMMGRYSVSLELFQETKEIATKISDQELLAKAYLGSGQSFSSLEKFNEALSELNQALYINENNLKDDSLLASILFSREEPFLRFGKLDEALADLQRAMKIYFKLNDSRNYYACMSYIGWEYFLKGELNEALNYVSEAYDGLFELNSILSAASSLLQKAIIQWKMRDLNSAINCATKAIEMFHDTTEDYIELPISYGYRALLHIHKGNLESAIMDFEKFKLLSGKRNDPTFDQLTILIEGLINKTNGKIENSINLWNRNFEIIPISILPYEIKKERAIAKIEIGKVTEGFEELKAIKNECQNLGIVQFSKEIDEIINGIYEIMKNNDITKVTQNSDLSFGVVKHPNPINL